MSTMICAARRPIRAGRRSLPRLFLVPLLAALLVSPPRGAAEPGGGSPAPAAAGIARPSVSVDRLREHVEVLASDRLAGRLAGTEGIRLAEEYIARKFQEYGLQPVPGARRGPGPGSNGYFLDFTLYRVGFDPRDTRLEGSAAGEPFSAEPGAGFRPLPGTGTGAVEGEVAFAGYGISAPEHGYDDYQGLDAQGRIVLLLRHEPNEKDPSSPFDGASLTRYSLFAEKLKNAARHGAVGVLLVTDPLHHPGPEDLRLQPLLSLEPPKKPRADAAGALPALQIAAELAGRLAAGSGRSLADLQREVDRGVKPAALGLGPVRAGIRVRMPAEAREMAARDVAGFLPGGDPQRRGEWILVGAHHDHLGAFPGRGDTVFNGADDNASGTAAVLELARLFGQAGRRPARSLLFVTYSAEEEGLLGSRAIVERRLLPLERISFVLNLDMIGRNPGAPMEVYGDATARPLRALLEEANRGLDLPLQLFGPRITEASDHTTWYQRDIPFLAFFTGLHADYHGLDDEADRLSYERMGRIVELGDRLLSGLAGRPQPLSFLHQAGWLGLQFEVAGQGAGRRAVVTGVMPGSPAERAGIREGDALAAVAGRELADPRTADERLAAIRPGTAARIGLARGDERLEVEVRRAQPGFLGIMAQPVEETRFPARSLEYGPEVLVERVVAGGPAERAGLRRGDVLVAIAGEPVGIDTLDSRLAQLGAGAQVELEVLRDGRRVTLPVTLGERPGARGDPHAGND